MTAAASIQVKPEGVVQQLWRTILSSIGDGVIATDVAGQIMFLNAVAEELTGWSATDAEGRSLQEVFHLQDETTHQDIEIPIPLAVNECTVLSLDKNTLLVARDGARRAIDDRIAAIVDDSGDISGIVIVFREISERKRADEGLARLAAIVESSDDAIVGKTLNGIIQTWNTGAQRMFGYSAAEAIGQPITLIVPPDRHEEESVILERLRDGQRIAPFETVRIAKDGRRLDVSVTISPIRDRAGRVIGASKVARDVTARNRMNEALRLRDEQLRIADRRKEELLATLAHELRNPLAPLRNGLQLLRLTPNNVAAVESTRQMMERQLTHLVRLIDDLLDVSSITRNRIELQFAIVRLEDVLQIALEEAKPKIEAGGHELNVSLPGEPILLNVDRTRMVQVFSNLLDNAAKFTEPGGRIELVARSEGDEIVVSVRDSGVGIAPDELPRVFDMFVQIDQSVSQAKGGLGIGLALVKRLVEMHGGTIDATSLGPGRGSEFSVRLKRTNVPTSSEPAPFRQPAR